MTFHILALSVLLLVGGCTSNLNHTPEIISARKITPYHVVQPGETVSSVAQKYDMNEDTLVSINKIETPFVLIEGQRLLVHKKDIHCAAPPAPTTEGTTITESDGIAIKSFDDTDRVEVGENTDLDGDKALPPKEPEIAWPVRGDIVAKFGTQKGDKANGIDIAAPVGTPVFPAAKGEVYKAQMVPGLGKTVLLRHPDGKMTIYGHLQSTTVRAKQTVTSKTKIGTVGKTGNTRKPRLHFQIRDASKKAVNPLTLLP